MTELSSKGDQARADILDAARRLFVSQGYNGTSMRAIAREAGDRAVGGIYNHFPTKEAIFEALIAERNPYDDILSVLESALSELHTAPEFIHGALSTLFQTMPRHYDFVQLAQIDLREFEGRHIGHVLQSTVFPRVFGLVQRVQHLPGMKPVDPIVWMRLMASMVIGYMITEQLVPVSIFRQLSPAEWAGQFADILLYGAFNEDIEP